MRKRERERGWSVCTGLGVCVGTDTKLDLEEGAQFLKEHLIGSVTTYYLTLVEHLLFARHIYRAILT